MSEVTDLKLNIVTAILNSEIEEEVSALLYSQGCNILYRAISVNSLVKFLISNDKVLTILYSSNFTTTKELVNLDIKIKKHTFIEVNCENYQPEQLLADIAQIGKPALIHKLLRQEKVYCVMGSPDSPGISTITNKLANYINATIIAASHHNLRPRSDSKVLKIKTEQLCEELSKNESQRLLIDAGAATYLTQNLSDRRLNAQWLSQSASSCSTLIYLIKANENGIYYLGEFIKDFSNQINPPKIIYLLNQQRFDRLGQMVQRQFADLVGASPNVQIPYDGRVGRIISTSKNRYSFWHSDSFKAQMEKIGKELTQ